MPKSKVWFCKIGCTEEVSIPKGADAPMRAAIRKAFKEITGQDCEAIFSGWDQEFSPAELHVIDPDKYPAPEQD